jgi:homoserine trans-succinylase
MKIKLSVPIVVTMWQTISNTQNLMPKNIATELAKILGFNPISITLLAQESNDNRIRSEAIQAYYSLMEEEMIQNSMDLSISS